MVLCGVEDHTHSQIATCLAHPVKLPRLRASLRASLVRLLRHRLSLRYRRDARRVRMHPRTASRPVGTVDLAGEHMVLKVACP